MKYFVGDPEICKILQFSDAPLGSDLTDSKSTSGAFLCLVGPNTFAPLAWICKNQGAVSRSSTEAEIIALDAGIRMEGMPCLMLWQQVVSMCKTNNTRDKEPTHQSISNASGISNLITSRLCSITYATIGI